MTHVFREWIRPNFLPQSLEVAIDRARTRRTVATSAESVKVQREIAVSQAQWLSRVLDAQRDGNALLRNVSDDLALLVDAIQMSVQGFAKFADRVDQRLAHQQERLERIERFSQHILDGIERSVRIQEQQLKIQNEQLLTLGRIESLLTSPEATKVREQLQLAMARYRRGLESSNPDSADDLNDALELFESIVRNPVGKQVHAVWYYLGILYESHNKDLRKALDAYKNSQRLAADLGDKDGIYLDSVLSLCKVYYRLQEHAEAYSRIMPLVKRCPNNTEVAFDAARYCAVTGRDAECFRFLRECLAKDRLFYLKIFDADFAALSGFDTFVETLTAGAKAAVSPDFQHLNRTLAAADRAAELTDSLLLGHYKQRGGELVDELETFGYLGAPKVQADLMRLNNSLIRSLEKDLNHVLEVASLRRTETELQLSHATDDRSSKLRHDQEQLRRRTDDKILREQARIDQESPDWDARQRWKNTQEKIEDPEDYRRIVLVWFLSFIGALWFAIERSDGLDIVGSFLIGFIPIFLASAVAIVGGTTVLATSRRQVWKGRLGAWEAVERESDGRKTIIEKEMRSQAKTEELELERRHAVHLDALIDSLRQEDQKIATSKALIAELTQLRMPEADASPA